MTPHDQHDASRAPVPGCAQCDHEIGRPILLGFGNGHSSAVIPRREPRGVHTDAERVVE
jgi:hypothetical protein